MQTGETSPRRKLEPLCAKTGRDNRADRVIHAFYARLRVDPLLHGFFDGITDVAGHEACISANLERPTQ